MPDEDADVGSGRDRIASHLRERRELASDDVRHEPRFDALRPSEDVPRERLVTAFITSDHTQCGKRGGVRRALDTLFGSYRSNAFVPATVDQGLPDESSQMRAPRAKTPSRLVSQQVSHDGYAEGGVRVSTSQREREARMSYLLLCRKVRASHE